LLNIRSYRKSSNKFFFLWASSILLKCKQFFFNPIISQFKTMISRWAIQASVGLFCVARFLVLCVVFYRSLFVLLSFFFRPLYCLFFFVLWPLITPLVSFGHCVVCSSFYGFWLPLWYLQTFLFYFSFVIRLSWLCHSVFNFSVINFKLLSIYEYEWKQLECPLQIKIKIIILYYA
jgi:hypothetical protein